jgi:membrane fusion protein (multidrug efflux system)
VVSSNVPIFREWVGTLDSEINATISAQVSGYLLSRNYDEGSMVTNGQVLFQIDPSPFEATLARAKAQLVEAQARKGKTAIDVRRYTPLAALQAISQQELDNAIQADLAAQGEVESAQAQIQQAQINLDFTTIRSPIDGIAGIANVTQAQVGNLVGPSTGALTTVTRVNPIRAYFSVSQQLMTEMQQRALSEGRDLRSPDPEKGSALQLTLASGLVYPEFGRVLFGNNQVDVKTGTITVVGEFKNPQGLLVPGMFVRVRARLGMEKDALLVPQRAVSDVQGRTMVAVIGADNKVSIRGVTAGERVGPYWLVKGDLKPGDKVVAEGLQKLREGAEVTPVAYDPTKLGTVAKAN